MPRQLLGTAIAANTITTTQLTTTVVTQISAGGGPKVKSLIYPGNDSAANSTGGQTVYITGSGFAANVQVLVNGSAVPSQSFISASNISFTTPALSTGTYPVYVINPEDGGTAILYPGLLISGEPTWVTGAPLPSVDASSAWSISLSASGDTPITYALAAGNTLPSGITLAANGLISGTISSPPESDTQYTFSVVASDAQNQDSTRQFTVTTSTGEGVLFANNVLLIHADGTNNQNNHTFLDSSNNNYTITRNGNATQGSFSPFSQTGWSNYFDGDGDFLDAGYNSNFTFGSGNFTIECWVHTQATGTIAGIWDDTSTNPQSWIISSANRGSTTAANINFVIDVSGSDTVIMTALQPMNKWFHLAVSRSGSSWYMFMDGVQVATATSSATISAGDGSRGLNLGGYNGANQSHKWGMNGYISNFRINKGTALYTSAFTPANSALTAVSGTTLLTCQSNRFIDNSSNGYSLTRNGNIAIQAFSPFAPTAAYSTANVGGSGYFDGSGDGLALNYGSTTHSFWNNDFTIEYWVKTTGTNLQLIISSWNDVGFGAGSYGFEINSSGRIGLSHSQSSGTNQGPFVTSGSTYVNDNAWHHIVLTQTTGAQKTFRLFVDGILRGYKQETNWTQSTTSSNIYIAQQGPNTYDEAGRYFTGHLSGFRLSNTVVAAYSTASTTTGTSVFSVPTAPPTNTANTVALLNYTNAGIFDQTAKNVLETVGDAKVSTAQYKYGIGSIVFDGTGDYIKITKNATLLNFGSGDFTVETWVRFNTVGADQAILGSDGTTGAYDILYRTGVGLVIGRYNTAFDSNFSWSPSINTWYHIAWCRSGSSLRAFVDGVQIGSTATNTNAYNGGTNYSVIGASDASNTRSLNGFLDDLRITKGYARYTSNFTPPTSALKDK
jgi:hypothetical protein